MSATVGKYGALEMSFELDHRGRTILNHLHRRVPMVVQQALYFDEQLPQMACVYMLSSGGPVVEGDRYRVRVHLGEGTMVHISTGAATVVATMEHDEAQLHQSITLNEGAYLEWLPRPLIPSQGASYRSTTEIMVAPTASFIYGEVVACGRKFHNERFDYRSLTLSLVVGRPSEEVVTRQALHIEPSVRHPSEWSLLGEFSHFGSLLVVAPPPIVARLREALHPTYGHDLRVSVGELAGRSGVWVGMVGHSSEQLLTTLHTIASMARTEIKGVAMPRPFPWR